MSYAARRVPGASYGLAIRTSERRKFLTPTAWVNLALRFLLGFYALRHGIQIHGYAFLSNHYHLVLTDPRGVLGDFMRDLNSKLARVLNFSLKRGEALFSMRDRLRAADSAGKPNSTGHPAVSLVAAKQQGVQPKGPPEKYPAPPPTFHPPAGSSRVG